jgi:cytochrome c-type biogenesis protein CcmH
MRARLPSAGRWLSALLALLIVSAVPALAVEPDEILPDPALEARARHISAGLRCLVCQNQSIDDSNAPLARDLRLLVRERLKAGDSDSQVTKFIEDRYGEFVLLRPPFEWQTLLLWLTPLLVLLSAIAVAWRTLTRGRTQPASQPKLTTAEEERLGALLAEVDDSKRS